MLGRVLIVDNDRSVLTVLREVLHPRGYRVDVSASPAEGLEMLSSRDYDLMITGMEIPEMDGLEFIRRAVETVPHIKIIAVTENPTEQNMKDALGLGASDYLPKPFTRSLFLDTVEKAFKRTERPSAGSRTIRQHLIKGHPKAAYLLGLSESGDFVLSDSSILKRKN